MSATQYKVLSLNFKSDMMGNLQNITQYISTFIDLSGVVVSSQLFVKYLNRRIVIESKRVRLTPLVKNIRQVSPLLTWFNCMDN